MSNFFFKPKTNKHLCCPPPIEKANINSPLLIYKFPCKIKLAMKIRSSVGSSNHNQCYTVANQTLNAYGKWAGCPGGSGPGYSSTMRFVPYDNGSGLGPSIGGAICNCSFRAPQPLYLPANIEAPIISGNTNYGSTLTLTGEGVWIGDPPPTLTFQWFRGTTPITNQTNITYVTQIADIGQQITCRVTGTNRVGSVNATSNVITVTLGPPQTITFTGTVNFETIYVNSLNQVVTNPVLGGFSIYRVTSTLLGATYLINSNLLSTPISFLIVGGGGSGASITLENTSTGGGGAGGFIQSSGTTNSNTSYSIYVGRGGFLLNSTASGENSLLQLNSGTLTAIGGGGGGNSSTGLNGLNGGSGGGGAYNFSTGTFGSEGLGTPGQGFEGGIGTPFAGSGGGAGGSVTSAGGGGVGLLSTITGQNVYYAGGGGSVGRIGGIGGGGNGGLSQNVSGTPGTNGLGGGGGSGGSGASGGSGVVILRIPSFI